MRKKLVGSALQIVGIVAIAAGGWLLSPSVGLFLGGAGAVILGVFTEAEAVVEVVPEAESEVVETSEESASEPWPRAVAS